MYLEGQVLQEVCGAICFCRLCPRTGINPHANGGGLGVGRVLGGDGKAILKSGGLSSDGRGDGGRKGAPQWDRRERLPGEALVEIESKSPRGHRGLGRGRANRLDSKRRLEVWKRSIRAGRP